MATLPHALAALVLCNFRFASFLQRAHSDFQIREQRFNHLICRIATQFFDSPFAAQSNYRKQDLNLVSRQLNGLHQGTSR